MFWSEFDLCQSSSQNVKRFCNIDSVHGHTKEPKHTQERRYCGRRRSCNVRKIYLNPLVTNERSILIIFILKGILAFSFSRGIRRFFSILIIFKRICFKGQNDILFKNKHKVSLFPKVSTVSPLVEPSNQLYLGIFSACQSYPHQQLASFFLTRTIRKKRKKNVHN